MTLRSRREVELRNVVAAADLWRISADCTDTAVDSGTLGTAEPFLAMNICPVKRTAFEDAPVANCAGAIAVGHCAFQQSQMDDARLRAGG